MTQDRCAAGLELRGLCTAAASPECKVCTGDEWGNPATVGRCEAKLLCQAGQFETKPGSLTSNRECKACPVGKYQPTTNHTRTACSNCPAGKYSTEGSSSCEECLAGTYSAAGAPSCTSCPSNTFTASNSSSRCTPCRSSCSHNKARVAVRVVVAFNDMHGNVFPALGHVYWDARLSLRNLPLRSRTDYWN